MARLWWLPIEPLEQRYSAQWFRWWRRACDQAGVPHTAILGEPLTDSIECGEFLDVFGTNYYKATQLQEVARRLRAGRIGDGDVLFVHDGWFPGLEAVAYMRDLTGIKLGIAAFFHAGSYDPWDFLGRTPPVPSWAQHCERAWLTLCDLILVGSQFHRDLLLTSRNVPGLADRIRVVGNLFDVAEIAAYGDGVHKENLVVFPHRLAPEKQPEVWEWLVDRVAPRWPDWRFVRTFDTCTDKADYYRTLARARVCVSTARQETWGIAMMESVALGCIPIVPRRCSYPELYPEQYVYRSKEELCTLVEMAMAGDLQPCPEVARAQNANAQRWLDALHDRFHIRN